MNNKPSTRRSDADKKKRSILIVLIAVLAVILVGLVIVTIILSNRLNELSATEPTEPPAVTTEPSEEPTDESTEPPETDPQMIPWMVELYEQNPELAYWVKIEGTLLDYPVMYTPDDPEKYIHKDFEGNYSIAGIPFMEDACDIRTESESDNLIIYGHNMNNGTQFRPLYSYTEKEFWEEHPQVTLTTMWEERTYDVLAVFYDRVYYTNENVFKFYQFIDAKDEEDFNRAINYYKNNALYDTGVDAEYGDRLLTLVTCSYHHEYGRFVLVARQSMDEPENTDTSVEPTE